MRSTVRKSSMLYVSRRQKIKPYVWLIYIYVERKTRKEPNPMMPKVSQITSAGTTFHSDNSDKTISDPTTITNAARTTIPWRRLASMVTKLTQARGHHYFAAKWFVDGTDRRRLPKKSLHESVSECLNVLTE